MINDAAELSRHLGSRGIRDKRVLEAIAAIPRDRFVPEELRDKAFEDVALPIDAGQTVSQPWVVARMSEALQLAGTERVLEVGTGSGYQAAVLSRLAGEVVTVERIESLSRAAAQLLSDLGCENVDCRVADGSTGLMAAGPWDAIMVTAAAPNIPQELLAQLSPGGRLIIPVGGLELQTLCLYENIHGGQTSDLCTVRFVPLLGQAGWSE